VSLFPAFRLDVGPAQCSITVNRPQHGIVYLEAATVPNKEKKPGSWNRVFGMGWRNEFTGLDDFSEELINVQ
jgi:hypothetical protein